MELQLLMPLNGQTQTYLKKTKMSFEEQLNMEAHDLASAIENNNL